MDDAARGLSDKAHAEGAVGLPEIGARLDRLASSRTIWQILLLLSFGGFFDAFSAYSGSTIAPGLYRSHILTATTKTFFSLHGYAGFTSATFIGLLLASSCFGVLADQFGRRAIFTTALLWFGVSGIIMAFQTTAVGVIFWRFMMSIGGGVEVITVNSYLSEMTSEGDPGPGLRHQQRHSFHRSAPGRPGGLLPRALHLLPHRRLAMGRRGELHVGDCSLAGADVHTRKPPLAGLAWQAGQGGQDRVPTGAAGGARNGQAPAAAGAGHA